jgi:uncharacterized protein YdhG (YjbR/CyaY superfamily)
MKTFDSVEDYIESFPKKIQDLLNKMRKTILEVIPDAEETFRYGMPTYRMFDTNLIHFAAMKNHVGFYPTPFPIVKFKKELKRFVTTKGAIQFPFDKEIPFSLVNKIIKFRIEEVKKKN